MKVTYYPQQLDRTAPGDPEAINLDLYPRHGIDLDEPDSPDTIHALGLAINRRVHGVELVASQPGTYALYTYSFEDKWYPQRELKAHLLNTYGSAPEYVQGTYVLVEA